ncbi:MAG: IPT/TIG domain-containing protein, partial [Bdellovibrionales bacterium]|nr:IPT/TIG domain-containing protein [Bdellovibrionales bacterium]
ISPLEVPANQNTTITVQGQNFIINENFNVKVNDQDCLSLTDLSAGQFKCLAPSYPSVLADNIQFKADIEIINGDGQTYKLQNALVYGNAPVFESVVVDPTKLFFDEGPLQGGRTIQLTGKNLFPGIKVIMGTDTECSDVEVISPTKINCKTPPKPQGSYGISLLALDGQFTNSPTDVFTYHLAPIMSSVTPLTFNESSPVPQIVVNGDFFRSGAVVYINGKSCNTSFITGQRLDCNFNQLLAGGSYSVQVLNPDFQSVILGNSLTVIPRPKVLKITPNAISFSQTRTVTVRGEYFENSPVITFGGNIPCTPVNYISPYELSCTVSGPGVEQSVGVRVTNPDQQFNSNLNEEIFHFISPPSITGIRRPELTAFGLNQNISEGPISGGNIITIVGNNFQNDSKVMIGDQKCLEIENVGVTQIKCKVPPSFQGESTVDVIVINRDGIDSNRVPYSYNNAPLLDSIDFNYATLDGQRNVNGIFTDSTITLSGQYFRPGSIIKVGGLLCKSDPVFVDSSAYRCTIPDPEVTGTYKTGIEIINSDGQSSFLFNAITYQGPPKITSITPNEGPFSGERVLIAGQNFKQLGDLRVELDNFSLCTDIVVESDSSLQCTMPASQVAGPRILKIVNGLDGQESINPVNYTYNEAPQISSVSYLSRTGNIISNPNVLIPENNIASITINGQFFLNNPVPKIYVDNVLCANISFVNSNQLTCLVLGAEAGLKDLLVENRDRQTTILSDAIEVVKKPVVNSVLEVLDAEGDGDRARGSLRGNYSLEINGENFLGVEPPLVTLEQGVCINPSYINDEKITCDLQPVSGFNGGEVKAKVLLFNGDESEYGTNPFSFIERPLIDLVNPFENLANSPMANIFTLEGRFINEGYYIWFVGPTTYRSVIGQGDCSVSSNKTVECSPTLAYNGAGFINGVSSLDAGEYDIVVSDNAISPSCDQNLGEYCSVLNNGIAFYGPPTISTITPNNGTTSEEVENTRITINGSNFFDPIKVFIGGEEANDCVRSSDTIITNCLVPTFDVGFKELQLYTKYLDPILEQNVTFNQAILYQNPPEILDISSGSGPNNNYFSTAGGETLTINGSNLNLGDVSTVEINGLDCPIFDRVGTTLKCTTPSGLAVGTYEVKVISPYPVLQEAISPEPYEAKQAQLDLSETSYDFGTQVTTLSQTFTLTNNGLVPVRIGVIDPITLENNENKNDGLTINSNGCGDFGDVEVVLSPGGFCTFNVKFWGGYQESDAFFGPISGDINILGRDGSTATLQLSGEREKIVYKFTFTDSTSEKTKSMGSINDWDGSSDDCTEKWEDFTIKNAGNIASRVAIRSVPNSDKDAFYLSGGTQSFLTNNCIEEYHSYYDVHTPSEINCEIFPFLCTFVINLRTDVDPYPRRIRLRELGVNSDRVFAKTLQPGEQCQFRVYFSHKIPLYKDVSGSNWTHSSGPICTNSIHSGTFRSQADTKKDNSASIKLFPDNGTFSDGIKLDLSGTTTD